jgi:pyruvate/2-oxoglutarate dehydrogenase complex dihydrolipoamide acyltransferase (E2) component
MSMRSLVAVAAVVAGLGVLASAPAAAECTRLGFSVNDYGKDGPTKDAKELLDKFIAKTMADRGIANYTVGKKDVSCELFLNLIVFDEHTCKAEATVCWGGSKPPRGGVAEPAAAPETKPAKAAATPAAAPEKKAEPKAQAKPAAKKPVTETGTLPDKQSSTEPSPAEIAAAVKAAAAADAAERAAAAAERAAAAAERAAAVAATPAAATAPAAPPAAGPAQQQ